MGPCVACLSFNKGEDVVMAFKCKPVNVYYSCVKFLGELGRAGDCFTLGDFGDCGEVS